MSLRPSKGFLRKTERSLQPTEFPSDQTMSPKTYLGSHHADLGCSQGRDMVPEPPSPLALAQYLRTFAGHLSFF